MASIISAGKPVKQCTVNTQERGKKYQAASSDGTTWYNLEVQPDGSLTCSCPARGHCYHMDCVAEVLKQDAATDGWDEWATQRNAQAVAVGIVSAERIETERRVAQAARRARAAHDKAELNGAAPAQYYRHTLSNGTSTFRGSLADGEGW